MLLLVQVASEGNQQESKWIQPQAHGVSVARRQRIRTRPGPRSENFTIPLRLKAIQYLDTTRSAVTPKGRFDPWRSLMGVSIRHVAVASGVYCEESCLVAYCLPTNLPGSICRSGEALQKNPLAV